jgi:hypothetical protein
MYLGEITRLILHSLISAGTQPTAAEKPALLFGGKFSEVTNNAWGVDTQYMSEVEEAWGGEEDDLPQFSSFDVQKLEENKKARLERVRKVVVKRFGYAETEVGLWDAAVCDSRPKIMTIRLPLHGFGRSSVGHVSWLHDVQLNSAVSLWLRSSFRRVMQC